jgi:Ca2+-binding EF-hand superfamily protein
MSISEYQLQQFIDGTFVKYDKDRSGTLDSNELASFFNDVFAAMGAPTRVTPAEASQAMAAIDKDRDGKAGKL